MDAMYVEATQITIKKNSDLGHLMCYTNIDLGDHLVDLLNGTFFWFVAHDHSNVMSVDNIKFMGKGYRGGQHHNR
jgi:hypothetical protein